MARILVVDDSALMRKKLREILEPEGYEVFIARDGEDALIKARECQPDLITLDINMPKIDGLNALAALLAENENHKVIMFSSLTQKGAEATLEALALGAYDFLPKPGGTISASLEEVEVALLEMVEQVLSYTQKKQGFSLAKTSIRSKEKLQKSAVDKSNQNVPKVYAIGKKGGGVETTAEKILNGYVPTQVPFNLTLIGVSTGGPRCLEMILRDLPKDYPNAIVVAQHMPIGFTEAFAQRLDGLCSLRVVEVASSEVIQPGHIYIARGGSDLAVIKRSGQLVAQRRPSSEQNLWHPSVSVLVESAMRVVPARQIVGVMLTGMGYDGAEEMAALKRAGGFTVAESEDTCVVFGMPKELIERGGACEVLDNTEIAEFLIKLSFKNGRTHGVG